MTNGFERPLVMERWYLLLKVQTMHQEDVVSKGFTPRSMDATSAAAPARRHFSLLTGPWHASSRLVALLVLLFLVFCNLPGQEVARLRYGVMPPVVADINIEYRMEHGWPLTFINRAPLDPFDPGLTVGNCFRFWNDMDEFVATALWANVAVALLLAGAMGMCFEAWRRTHKRLFQVHVRDLLGVVVVVSAAGAWYLNQRQEYADQDAILHRDRPLRDTPEPNLECTYQVGGVTWLRILLGDQAFEFLDRPFAMTVFGRDGWSQLRRFPSLRRVEGIVHGTAADLRQLTALPNLEALSLDEYDPFEYGGTREPVELPSLRRLRGLQLSNSPYLYRGIDRAPLLEVVSLSKVDDRTFHELSRLCELRELSLNFAPVTADRLLALSSLPKLRALALDHVCLDASALLAIGQFHNLTYLEVWDCSLAEGELKEVANLKQLETLRLRGTNVASQDLAPLVGLPLKELYLGGTQVDRQAIPHILKFSELRQLVLPSQGFSSADEQLLREQLPKCEIHFER